MSLDFGVMPNLEWTALSVEPGCRQAAMDPQIKLFGRILSVTPSHIGAGADAGVLINPTSVSPPSRQDGGDSVHRGAENKGVSEKLVSARSSSGDDFLLLIKKVNESCGRAAAPPPQQQQQQQLCEESESAQSDELRDHSSTHSGGNNNNDGKKPDKVVACPRCNSQETKFCYYNNYNVNQPRHFCKNCQRYWTAGGTLRNVPVGAGRRKNKTGNAQQQQQRENDASPNCSSFQMDSSEFSCGLSSPRANKLSHPKRLSGQGSPLRSPGSTSPFGPDSVISMSSPMYSLCQTGRLPFQSFDSCTQGFTTSGVEMSAVGSSDSAPALRGQRLVCLPSPAGFDKDGTRPSFSEQVQGAANLNTVRFFNGEWPHGYTHDWDGNHHPHPISQGFTPVLTTYNTATTPTPTPPSSWSPAGWMGDPQWPANPPQPLQFTLGKRHRDTVDDMVPSKSPRTENAESRTDVRSKWPMLPGRNAAIELQQSRGTLKQLLHHPKVEPSNTACDPKDTFFSRMFKSTTAPRLVPFPVTT